MVRQQRTKIYTCLSITIYIILSVHINLKGKVSQKTDSRASQIKYKKKQTDSRDP